LLMRMRSRDGNRRSSRAPSQQSTVHQAQGHLRGKCMKWGRIQSSRWVLPSPSARPDGTSKRMLVEN